MADNITTAEDQRASFQNSGVLVVLYQPDPVDVEHLLAINKKMEHVVAVDNSPSPDLDLHRSLRSHDMTVLANFNRGGIAGAYNAGTELLSDRGCTHVFLLDQDTRLPDNYFAEMLAAAVPLTGKDFLLAPNAYEEHTRREFPVFPLTTGVPRPQIITKGELVPLLFAVSAGTLFSVSAFRRIGRFREDFFLEYVDIEYCLRANRSGVRVHLHPALVLRQRSGESERHGRSFSTNYPAWRRYYRARNCALTWRAHGCSSLSVPVNLADVVRILRFEVDKAAKIAAVFTGWWDGLLGDSGTLPDLHPARAARWGHPPLAPGRRHT